MPTSSLFKTGKQSESPDLRHAGVYKSLRAARIPPMNQIWCNGQWLDSANYPGSSQDRGAFLGLGLFETLLAIDGVPVFADRHLARLRKSGEKLRWELDFPHFRKVAAALLTRNQLATGRARLRLIVTGGSGPHNDLVPGADRLFWLSAHPIGDLRDTVSLCLSPWPRNECSPLAGLKTACYAENLVALDHARRLGFDEAIFLNTAGQLCETATANLFLVKNETLLTPPLDSGCLPGIAREVVLELAARYGLNREVRPLAPADLESADEIFLTSSVRGVAGVSRLAGRDFCKGTITERLKEYWNEEIVRESRG